MNQQLAAIIILLLSFICLPIYYKTKNYLKFPGILLFIFGLSALTIRIIYIDKPIDFYTEESFLAVLAIIWLPASIVFGYFVNKTKFFKKNRRYFFTLLPFYLLFGALQQLFFICVVSESIYVLTSNVYIAFVFGLIYYFLFHLNWKEMGIQKYLPLLILFGILSIGSYFFFHNLIPQLLVHGFAGAVLFSANTKVNQIKLRLK